jgi:hypothetical protein
MEGKEVVEETAVPKRAANPNPMPQEGGPRKGARTEIRASMPARTRSAGSVRTPTTPAEITSPKVDNTPEQPSVTSPDLYITPPRKSSVWTEGWFGLHPGTEDWVCCRLCVKASKPPFVRYSSTTSCWSHMDVYHKEVLAKFKGNLLRCL